MTPEKIEEIARSLAYHPRIRAALSNAVWLRKRTVITLVLPALVAGAEEFTAEDVDAIAIRAAELHQDSPVPEPNEYRYPLDGRVLYDMGRLKDLLCGQPLQIERYTLGRNGEMHPRRRVGDRPED